MRDIYVKMMLQDVMLWCFRGFELCRISASVQATWPEVTTGLAFAMVGHKPAFSFCHH